MRRATVALVLFTALAICAGGDPARGAQSRTPVTAQVKKLGMSPEELRIRVRALIRPTLGMVEEVGDRSLKDATAPSVRRGILVWKIEATSTLLSALLRKDPLLALADAWAYAFQVEALLARPEIVGKYGSNAQEVSEPMAQMRSQFRARWEAELGVDDIMRGGGASGLSADIDRVASAADRLAGTFEKAPDLLERERAAIEALREERLAATRDLRGERVATLDVLRKERIEALQEVEAIIQRTVDGARSPLREEVQDDLKQILREVEAMRGRLIEDAGTALNRVVDHAFLRALELLLLAALLAAGGIVLHARLVRP